MAHLNFRSRRVAGLSLVLALLAATAAPAAPVRQPIVVEAPLPKLEPAAASDWYPGEHKV